MSGSTRFAGAVAVVTGAASGIGLATARALAAEGATVWLTDRDHAPLEEAGAGLGASHCTVMLDVTEEAGWENLAAEIGARHGKLDILVNNAGAAQPRRIADTTFAEWRASLAVNLDSVFLGTRAMLPLLARGGSGEGRSSSAIVNVSSVRGIIGGANFAAYCAAKGAVRMLTKATAVECATLGQAVRANSVHPGFIESPLTAAAVTGEARTRRMADIPLGRGGTPEEVAEAILFLASEASSYMTGSELVIDGGTVAQ